MHTPGLPSQGFWRGVALEARHPGPRLPALRLLYAAALFAAAVLVRYGLDQIAPGHMTFITFFPAIAVAAFLCGS